MHDWINYENPRWYVCVPTGRVQSAASTEVRDLLSRFPECVLLGGIAARVETQKALCNSCLSLKKRTNLWRLFLWRGYPKFDSLGLGFILWTNWIWCSNFILPSSGSWSWGITSHESISGGVQYARMVQRWLTEVSHQTLNITSKEKAMHQKPCLKLLCWVSRYVMGNHGNWHSFCLTRMRFEIETTKTMKSMSFLLGLWI